MRLKYLLFVVILSALIIGCVAPQQSGYGETQKTSYGKSNQNSFNCDTIGAEPQLFYVLGC